MRLFRGALPARLSFALSATAALLLAACGGAESTPTRVPPTPTTAPTPAPVPAPTATATPTLTTAPTPTRAPASTPGPSPTAAPATPSPAGPPPTATRPAPTPAPTATPVPATPTAIAGKRGGTLQTRSVFNIPIASWDSFEALAAGQVSNMAPVFNNLIFIDPYLDGKTLAADAAQGWDFTEGGKVLTFKLRRGITWHDGGPFTSKDVAYNFDRAWKPRAPTTNFFKARFQAIEKIEIPDDLTVKITLAAPSNVFLQAVGLIMFQMYPAHIPFPEKGADFNKSPIGTGPFKFKSVTSGADVRFERHSNYWKPGLPYLDGVTITQMTPDVALAAFRTGRVDASNLDTGTIEKFVEVLKKQQGFIYTSITNGLYGLNFNRKEPWTNPKVREAIDLAIDRQAIVDVWLEGRGTGFAAPLLPPEMGGLWGISTEVMKNRPGFRTDKTQDLARAKQLLAESGTNPGQYTVTVLGNTQTFIMAELVEPTFRALGFKTALTPVPGGSVENDRLSRGEFDVHVPSTGPINFDDPLDFQANWFTSDGGWNYGKWSDPQMDAMFTEQDRTLDSAKRKQLLLDLQERMLMDRRVVLGVWRTSFVGHMPWVKNFPLKLPFQYLQKFRHEQVWLER